MPRSVRCRSPSTTTRPAIVWPSTVRSVRARTSESAVLRYSTCGFSSLWMWRTMSPASRARAETSGSDSSSTPHANVPSAKTSTTHTLAIIASMRSSVASSIGNGRSAEARCPVRAIMRIITSRGNLRLLEREVARRFPHLLVAALVAPARLVARVRLEQAAVEMQRARCPRAARRSARLSFGTFTSRITAPKPSTIEMIVNVRTIGSRTPCFSNSFDCATFGYCGGISARGTSTSACPSRASRACQAATAGPRCSVRGER